MLSAGSGVRRKARLSRSIGPEPSGRGAFDFLAKPIEIAELKIVLKRAFHLAQLESELRKMQPDVVSAWSGHSHICA